MTAPVECIVCDRALKPGDDTVKVDGGNPHAKPPQDPIHAHRVCWDRKAGADR